MLHLKKMAAVKMAVAGAVFALACNVAVADIASDFKDPNISIDMLVSNALNQDKPVAYTDILGQLQTAGADENTIELAVSSMIQAAINGAKSTSAEAAKTCSALNPNTVSGLLTSAYEALDALNASPAAYNQLTEAVYETVSACNADVIAAVGEAALNNPNVDPLLATAPTAAGGPATGGALAAPPPPPPPGGSGGGGAASPS